MAGQPRTRARRTVTGPRCGVPGCDRAAGFGTTHTGTGNCNRHEHWVRVGQAPLPPDAKLVALAGAVLLGQYRGTIAASGSPLQTSLEVLDEQLPEYVAQVHSWVHECAFLSTARKPG